MRLRCGHMHSIFRANRRPFFLVCAVTLATTLWASCTIPASTTLHATGLLLLTDAQYGALPEGKAKSLSTNLPSSWDLTADFPSPGDQGAQVSCVGWATGYELSSYQEHMANGSSLSDNSHLMSPSFIFNQIKIGDGSTGGYLEDALNLVLAKGDCSLATMPYDPSECSTVPTQAAFTEAKQHAISSWGRIDQSSISTIKNFIATSAQPVIIGVKVFPDLDNLTPSNPIYDDASGTSRAYHTVVLIGYDDSKNAFKFENCWGTGWGVGGYGWISYDIFPSVVMRAYVAE